MQLGEMNQWTEASPEELRSRKRNDHKEEQSCGCFKAKLRSYRDVFEKRLYSKLMYLSLIHI